MPIRQKVIDVVQINDRAILDSLLAYSVVSEWWICWFIIIFLFKMTYWGFDTGFNFVVRRFIILAFGLWGKKLDSEITKEILQKFEDKYALGQTIWTWSHQESSSPISFSNISYLTISQQAER